MPPLTLPVIPPLTVTSVIDILAVAFLIYQFVLMVRGRRAAYVLGGIGMLTLCYLIAVGARLELLRSILAAAAPYTAIALIVMFQSELRRMLARLGRSRWLGLGGQLERREVVEEIILALEQMSELKTGALIVVERDIGLRTFVESGVPLNAAVSRDLLCAIFHPGGALHDGAVILQGEHLAAAACFLPLTMNPQKLRKLGTRHRAAIGITEESDCHAIVVSEETGQISIAARGDLESMVSLERVRECLTSPTSRRRREHERAPEPEWKQVEP